jgi:hypothetical protein
MKGNQMIKRKMDIDDILALLRNAKLFQPVVSEVLDETLDTFGPELAKVTTRFREFMVEETVASVEQYQKLGFSREEAIAFTLNDKQNLRDAIRNMKGR